MTMYDSPESRINLKRVLRKECEEEFPAWELGKIYCDLAPHHSGAHSTTLTLEKPFKPQAWTMVVTWTDGGDLETLTEWAPMDEALWAKIKNHSLFQDGPSGRALPAYRRTEEDSGD